MKPKHVKQDDSSVLRERVGRAEAERDAMSREVDALRARLEAMQHEANVLRERVGRAEAECHTEWRDGVELRKRLEATQLHADSLRTELARVYVSRSWRVTGPLRAAKRPLVACRKGMQATGDRLAKVLRKLGYWAGRQRLLRGFAERMFQRWPDLRRPVRLLMRGEQEVAVPPSSPSPRLPGPVLSAEVRDILRVLHAARARYEKTLSND